jgi:hypothetical protein
MLRNVERALNIIERTVVCPGNISSQFGKFAPFYLLFLDTKNAEGSRMKNLSKYSE